MCHNIAASQNLSCNPCTGLGISKGIVVHREVVAAKGCNSMQLMILCTGKSPAGSGKGVVKAVVGIIHLINLERGFKAALVKAFVMSHQRQPLNERLHLLPHLAEHRCLLGIFARQAMHSAAPIGVIVWLGLYKRIERVGNLTVTHNHHAHAAHRTTLAVGRLKIYSRKIFHLHNTCFCRKFSKFYT